jgi:hypothetical protein
MDAGSVRGVPRRRPLAAACARWPLAPAALVLALVAAFFLRGGLPGQGMLLPVDALGGIEPWSSATATGSRAQNPLLLDQPLVVLPWLEFAAQRVHEGELPLWNPHNYLGQPIAAAASGGLWFPLHWLYLAFPGAWFFGFAAWTKLALAGLFALLFLRRVGASSLAALLGATAWMLSGFLVAWLGHPHASVAMFLPALLWSVERTAAAPRWRESALAAAWVALALLGGHMQTALHVLAAAGAYACWRALAGGAARPGARALAVLALGAALGALLAAPQLLPFLEYVERSRAGESFAELEQHAPVDWRVAAAYSVWPERFGQPHHGDYSGPVGTNLNYSELSGAFVGRVALALAIFAAIARLRESRVRFLALLAGAALLVSWQTPGVYELAERLPLLGSTKLMRLSLLAAFALSVLAALGLDRLLGSLAWTREAKLAAAIVLTLGAAFEGYCVGRGYNPSVDPASVRPPAAWIDRLRADAGPARVLPVESDILAPNTNMLYGLDVPGGYDSIELAGVNRLVMGLASRYPRHGFLSEVTAYDRLEALPLAALLNVRYVVSRHSLPAPLDLVHDGEVKVFVNPLALPRAFVAPAWTERTAADGTVEVELPGGPIAAGGSVDLERYEPRRVALAATLERPGLLVLSDAWFPGWRASVDGRETPIWRAQGALRALPLEPGDHRVTMEYDPASTRIGLWLAVAAIFACAILACSR